MVLTNAEKQARWRAKRAAEIAAMRFELVRQGLVAADAAVGARIRELEAELAGGCAEVKVARAAADPASELAKAKAMIAELGSRLRYFQKRPKGKIDARTFTLLRGRVHPDRVAKPEQKARYRIAFEVLGEIEREVVDRDQLRLARGEDALQARPEKKPAAAPRQPRRLPGSGEVKIDEQSK